MFFDLSSCPSGWTEATSARGRYLVALPSGGSLAGTAGTALSNLENRPVGQHSHSINDPGHAHGLEQTPVFGGATVWYQGSNATGHTVTATQSAGTGITIQNAGSVTGTNAPYIQYLLCKKN